MILNDPKFKARYDNLDWGKQIDIQNLIAGQYEEVDEYNFRDIYNITYGINEEFDKVLIDYENCELLD